MDLLLDTHALIWYREGSSNILLKTRTLISDTRNNIFISIASIWELTIKQSIGKIELNTSIEELYLSFIKNNYTILPIKIEYLSVLKLLPDYHKDPFDRLLIATAIAQNIPVITKDQYFNNYPIQTIWE